jgi:hypothetical protein
LETREIGVSHGKELRECDEISRGGVGARGENPGEPLRSSRVRVWSLFVRCIQVFGCTLDKNRADRERWLVIFKKKTVEERQSRVGGKFKGIDGESATSEPSDWFGLA